MNDCQARLRDRLIAVVSASQSAEITYRSEWLGYLPFGVYHWLEHQGQDLASGLPGGWTLADLAVLEQSGCLTRIDSYQNPQDEFDCFIRYQVDIAGA